MWFVPIILPVLICSFFRFTLAIIQVFLSVLKFDNLNMVSMHYKLRLWCSSLYLKLVCATLDPLKVLVARGFPLTPFPGFCTPGFYLPGVHFQFFAFSSKVCSGVCKNRFWIFFLSRFSLTVLLFTSKVFEQTLWHLNSFRISSLFPMSFSSVFEVGALESSNLATGSNLFCRSWGCYLEPLIFLGL